METLFIILIIIAIIIGICCITYTKHLISNINLQVPTIYFIKDLDNNNIININEIEQITQRYNVNTKQYEIVYYIKSGHELKEEFIDSSNCQERFTDIYRILNNLNC